jgi:hypothetical protein
MIAVTAVNDRLVIDYRARGHWCALPYPDHPRGCPKLPDCPACYPTVEDWGDLSRPVWFAWERFDLDNQEARMRARHSEWSKRQCRNLLYWQRHVRYRLARFTRDMCAAIPGTHATLCPEGMGVNVLLTLNHCDISVENKPIHTATIVAMIAYIKPGGPNDRTSSVTRNS